MDSHIGAESVASSTQDIGALRYSGLPLGNLRDHGVAWAPWARTRRVPL